MIRSIMTITLLCVMPVFADDVISATIRADVIRVYDGDTFTARAMIWPR